MGVGPIAKLLSGQFLISGQGDTSCCLGTFGELARAYNWFNLMSRISLETVATTVFLKNMWYNLFT